MTRQLRSVPLPAPAHADAPLLGGTVHFPTADAEPLTELAPDDRAAHLRRHGPRPDCTGERGRALLHALDAAALSGRGGGHFPVAAKWRRVQQARLARGLAPVVIGNGSEGEPLSRKDRSLLELRPHLVLDGLACAAETVGADRAVLYLHEDAHAARTAVLSALAERPAGEPPVQVALGPHHYLTGESSAVVRALSGGPARPGFRQVPAAEAGVDGRPTLVQNVETLARIALLARGRPAASTLLTLAGAGQLVVAEFDEGVGLRQAVRAVLGGPQPQAVLVGGYGGRWLAWADADTPVTEAGLRARGASLGAGIVAPLAADRCGLARTAEIVAYLAASGARQCGPCRLGLPAIAAVCAELAEARARRRDRRRLDRFLAEVSGRGACHHPDGAVGLVRSALQVFADDVAAHLERRRCRHEDAR